MLRPRALPRHAGRAAPARRMAVAKRNEAIRTPHRASGRRWPSSCGPDGEGRLRVLPGDTRCEVLRREADPRHAAGQAGPAPRRHASARACAHRAAPPQRAGDRRRRAVHGGDAGRRLLRQELALSRPGREAAEAAAARRTGSPSASTTCAGRRGSWRRPAAGRHLPEHRGGLRRHPRRRGRRTSTPSPGSTATATCGADRRRPAAAARPRPACRWPAPSSASALAGGYAHDAGGVRMRDGSSRAVRVIAARGPAGRAAAGGDLRRRAASRRSAAAAASTAPPPTRWRCTCSPTSPCRWCTTGVLPWEMVKPDLVQRMLLAGVAVDSPADAARLHPACSPVQKQAKKAFERAGFKGQIPIRNIL